MMKIHTKMTEYLKEEKNDIKISNEWLFTINLKEHITNDTDMESIKYLAENSVKKLNRLIKSVENSRELVEEERDYYLSNLEEIKMEFDSISEDTDEDESELLEWANTSMEKLYDLADSRTVTKNKISKKFLWIK